MSPVTSSTGLYHTDYIACFVIDDSILPKTASGISFPRIEFNVQCGLYFLVYGFRIFYCVVGCHF